MKIKDYNELGKNIEGVYTLETLCDRLKTGRRKTIYIIYRLKKLGFVKTKYGAGKHRVYSVSIRNMSKRTSYTEEINKLSPVKLASSNPSFVYQRKISYEELLIYAIKQRDVRHLIASLSLFRRITNWSLLYNLAKKEGLLREVAALYEIARRVVSKVRRMPKRFSSLAEKSRRGNLSLESHNYSSKSFKDIQDKWKVRIPLEYADLEDYKR